MKRAFLWFPMLVAFIGVQSTYLLADDTPDGWVSFPISDDALNCGNYSKREWEVKLDDGQLKVVSPSNKNQPLLPFTIAADSKMESGLKGERRVEKVENGWLVGFNAGEWGGALWWFSEDGKIRKKLTDENVVGLAKTSTRILALTGLAHLGMDHGKVFDVTQDKTGKWKADVLVNLGAAPQTFIVESPESVLVITTKSLVRVKTEGSAEQLYQHRYLFLYPNSMTLSKSGIIHIGMRHFVTRLTPTQAGYKEDWFVPKDCRQFELREYDCICLGTTTS